MLDRSGLNRPAMGDVRSGVGMIGLSIRLLPLGRAALLTVGSCACPERLHQLAWPAAALRSGAVRKNARAADVFSVENRDTVGRTSRHARCGATALLLRMETTAVI